MDKVTATSEKELKNSLKEYNDKTQFNYDPTDISISIIIKIINRMSSLPLNGKYMSKGMYELKFIDTSEMVRSPNNVSIFTLPNIKLLDILFIIWFLTEYKNINITNIVFPQYLQKKVEKAYNFSKFFQDMMIPTIVIAKHHFKSNDELEGFISDMLEQLPFAYEQQTQDVSNPNRYSKNVFPVKGGRYKKSKKSINSLKSKKSKKY